MFIYSNVSFVGLLNLCSDSVVNTLYEQSLFQAVILAENVVYALKILAEKCSLRAFTASRKASRKFSQASRKPEKLRLGGLHTHTNTHRCHIHLDIYIAPL